MSLSSAEALVGYDYKGSKPLHDATPNMAVNREAYNYQTQNSSQNVRDNISFIILQQAHKGIIY
jgi:hypothetical protein